MSSIIIPYFYIAIVYQWLFYQSINVCGIAFLVKPNTQARHAIAMSLSSSQHVTA